jgi:uncharacterized membrane protein YhaH (DUF805 family)
MDLKTLLLTVSGRIGRKTYWLSALGLFVANLVLQGASWLVMSPTTEDGHIAFSVGTLGTFVLLALFVVMFVLSISGLLISIKRCHDRDRSGWFMLAMLIPLVGPIWVLVELGFLRGTVGPNRFGPDSVSGSMLGALPA